jgi:hypothetical protein
MLEIARAMAPADATEARLIEMYALDCERFEAILKETSDPVQRAVKVMQEPSRWQVEVVGRGGSLDPTAHRNVLLVDVRGAGPAQLGSIIRDVALDVKHVERPPASKQACLYGLMSTDAPRGVPSQFKFEVPANTRDGDLLSAWQLPESNDAIGYQAGQIKFQVQVDFDAPGSYEYSVHGRPGEAARPSDMFRPYSGVHRWMRLNSLDGWRVHVDSIR